MRIVVMGLPKSGTTALYSALVQSLPSSYIGLFEPVHLESDNHDVVAKILIGDPANTTPEEFESFDKTILIVRDPRDTLVSYINYLPYNLQFYKDTKKRAAYLKLLQAKHENPLSIPLNKLIKFLSKESGIDLVDRVTTGHNYVVKYADKYHMSYSGKKSGPFLMQYDHLMRRHEYHWGSNLWLYLEYYIGDLITFNDKVDDRYARVERQKRTGNWAHWFTPEDVEFWNPYFQPFIQRFVFDGDWKLKPNPAIEYEHSVGYFRRLINEREAMEEWPKSGTALPFTEWLRQRDSDY
jgi:hypothetical protein